MIETSAEMLGVIGVALTAIGGISGKLLDRAFTRARERAQTSAQVLEAIQSAQKNLTEMLFDTIAELRLEIAELQKHLDECEGQHADVRAKFLALQQEVTGMRCSLRHAGLDCALAPPGALPPA